jgi:hypothetical protein
MKEMADAGRKTEHRQNTDVCQTFAERSLRQTRIVCGICDTSYQLIFDKIKKRLPPCVQLWRSVREQHITSVRDCWRIILYPGLDELSHRHSWRSPRRGLDQWGVPFSCSAELAVHIIAALGNEESELQKGLT